MELEHTLFLAAAATGVAALARALPWPKAWLGRKPLSCNVCLGGHGAWLVLLVEGLGKGFGPLGQLFFTYFAVTALAALALTYLFPVSVWAEPENVDGDVPVPPPSSN